MAVIIDVLKSCLMVLAALFPSVNSPANSPIFSKDRQMLVDWK